MADEGYSGVGSEFQRWNPVTELWVPISRINKITGPSKSRKTHTTTGLDTAGGYETFIGGLRDGGNVVFNMFFTRAGYDLINTDFEDDDLQNYQIILSDPDHTSFEFEGLVTELPLTVGEEPIVCDVTIKISGAVAMESGSAASPA